MCEALEPRTLFSQTWTVADTGVASTNGTTLNNILNGTHPPGRPLSRSR